MNKWKWIGRIDVRYNRKPQAQLYGESFVRITLLGSVLLHFRRDVLPNPPATEDSLRSLRQNRYHIFWSCPLLIPVWQEVHKVLQKVFWVDIPFTLSSMYMGGLLREIVASHVRYLFWILSAAGRKVVMRKWL